MLGAAQAKASAALAEADGATRTDWETVEKAGSRLRRTDPEGDVPEAETIEACLSRADASLCVGAFEEASNALDDAARLGATASAVDSRRCTIVERAAVAAADATAPPDTAKRRRVQLVRLVGPAAAASLMLKPRSDVLSAVRADAAAAKQGVVHARMLVFCCMAEIKDGAAFVLADGAADPDLVGTVLTWSLSEARHVWSTAVRVLPPDCDASETTRLRAMFLDAASMVEVPGESLAVALEREEKDAAAMVARLKRLRATPGTTATTAAARAKDVQASVPPSRSTATRVKESPSKRSPQRQTRAPAAKSPARAAEVVQMDSDDDLL